MARQKAEDWRARLARFEASGLTVAEFSLRERVDARQLRWWKWRLAQEAVSSTARAVGAIPSFAPVVIEAATVTSSGSSPIEIVLPGGGSVRVGAGFDTETLRRVLAVMSVV